MFEEVPNEIIKATMMDATNGQRIFICFIRACVNELAGASVNLSARAPAPDQRRLNDFRASGSAYLRRRAYLRDLVPFDQNGGRRQHIPGARVEQASSLDYCDTA